jgi:hypothetical protein
VIHLPERTRADIRFYTAMYAGLWLGSLTQTLLRARKTAPAPAPASEETPHEDHAQ